jgi:hypothetical protein
MNRNLGPDSFTDELYQIVQVELILVILQYFQNVEVERMLPNTFYEATITLLRKPEKTHKNYSPFSLINSCKKSSIKY